VFRLFSNPLQLNIKYFFFLEELDKIKVWDRLIHDIEVEILTGFLFSLVSLLTQGLFFYRGEKDKSVILMNNNIK